MKRFFKWVLLISVVLAAAITIVLYNPNLIKGPLQRHLGKLSGYSVVLGGAMDISVGRTIAISARNVRIASPQWPGGEDFATIGSLSLSLDGVALFKQAPVVEDLRLDTVRIKLETDTGGNSNWEVTRQATRDGDEAAGPGIFFSNVQLRDATVAYHNAQNGSQHKLHVASFSQQRLPDDMLDIVLQASFNDRPVEFAGVIGPYRNLLQRRQVFFSAGGNFGSIDIQGEGLVDDLLNPRWPQFDLSLQGPDIDEITAMLDVDDLGSGIFTLRALGGKNDDRFEAGIDGKVGDVTLNLSLEADDLASLAVFDLEFNASGPNLGAMTRVLGVHDWPDKPFIIKGSVQRVGHTLNIPETTLEIGGSRMVLDALLDNFPTLDASRVKLTVTGDDIALYRNLLGIRGLASGPFDITARLDVSPGEVELVQVDVNTALGKMSLAGSLGEAPDYYGSRLHLQLQGQDANQLMSVFGIDLLPEYPFSLDTHLLKTERGLEFERGLFVTVGDDRIELDGLVSLDPGSKGTDVKLKINGERMGKTLGRVTGGLEFADVPYDLSGRIRVLDEGVHFEGFSGRFANTTLDVNGSLNLWDDGWNDSFDFSWRGDDFSATGDLFKPGLAMDIFIPGQAFQADGVFGFTDRGWELSGVTGRIGDTDIAFSGFISKQVEHLDTRFEFSLEGPRLYGFVHDRDLSDSPPGAFKTSGNVSFSSDSLVISDFHFDAQGIRARLDLQLGLPLSVESDTRFDIRLDGDDIRHLAPANGWFEPFESPFHIAAVGSKQGPGIVLRQLDLDVGGLDVSMTGTQVTGILFNAIAEDLSGLGLLHGRSLPALPLDLKAELAGDARHYVFRDISGLLGDSDVSGEIGITLGGVKPVISVNAESGLIDLRPFLHHGDEQNETVAGQERIIPHTPLPFSALEAADASFELEVGEVKLGNNTAYNLSLRGAIDDGSLEVPHLQWSVVGGGTVQSAFSVEPSADGPAVVRADFDARNAAIGYRGLTRGQQHTTPPMDISFHAVGKGDDLRTLAGSANGSLFIGSTGGVLPDVNLSLLDTFILDKVFDLILGTANDADQLTLTCFAAVFDIQNGLVKTDPAYAFTTDKINLVAKGQLDLKSEAIRFNFTATPKNILNISASELINPYILVSGTLSDPVVGVDAAKTLIHGGAAIGTSGISILGKALLDRIGATAPVCNRMLKQRKPG